MTLLRTKIKREAKEIVRYTKRKVKKIAKKIATRPGTKPKKKPGVKKKNPIYTDNGTVTFKELLSGFDKNTRELVRDAYEPYEEGNQKRNIDTARPSQIVGMITSYLKDYDFNFEDYKKLMAVVYEVNKLPKNTEIELP